MGFDSVVQLLLERGAKVEAEAQWCGIEDGEGFDNGAMDIVDKSLRELLQRFFLEQESSVDVEGEARHCLTARQIAFRRGEVEIEQLSRWS